MVMTMWQKNFKYGQTSLKCEKRYSKRTGSLLDSDSASLTFLTSLISLMIVISSSKYLMRETQKFLNWKSFKLSLNVHGKNLR